MEENEVQEVENESGASEGASPEPASTEESSAALEAKAESSETQTEDNVPFHEHPRFKELVEQKNQAIAQQKELSERYSKLEGQLKELSEAKRPATTEEKDELIEDLRKIDPRLADRLEQATKSFKTLENLQQSLQAQAHEQVRVQAVDKINQLHSDNKASQELQGFINNQLDAMYRQGQLTDIKQVPVAYKSIFDTYSKFIEGIKRSTLEGYVPAKKADAKVPTSQPKGQPASQSQKQFQFSKNPEVARAQVVQRYLKQAKAEADI